MLLPDYRCIGGFHKTKRVASALVLMDPCASYRLFSSIRRREIIEPQRVQAVEIGLRYYRFRRTRRTQPRWACHARCIRRSTGGTRSGVEVTNTIIGMGKINLVRHVVSQV